MSDYTYWRKALTGENPPVHEGDPQPGFYFKKDKKLGRLPVAIWEGGPREGWVCKVGNKIVDAVDVWTWVAGNPITEELYREVMKTGKWPDDPGLGHNVPDDRVMIDEQIDEAVEKAGEIGKIMNKEQADIAANIRDRLNQLAKEADAKRKAEREPLNAQLKEIQQKWVPIIDRAKSNADEIRKALTIYLNAVEAKKREALKKAAAEAEKAGEVVPDTEPEKVNVGGLRGKKAGLTTVVSAKIVDYDKAVMALKNDPAVKDLIQKLANKVIKAGGQLPGVERVETKEAR